jgi:hypothetical protein
MAALLDVLTQLVGVDFRWRFRRFNLPEDERLAIQLEPDAHRLGVAKLAYQPEAVASTVVHTLQVLLLRAGPPACDHSMTDRAAIPPLLHVPREFARVDLDPSVTIKAGSHTVDEA